VPNGKRANSSSPLRLGRKPRPTQDVELLRTYPGFDTLPAARNNRIRAVDANAGFSLPGPRIVESLGLLANIPHPGV
jgi:iron complex transport system substrate-binding protein